MPLVIKKMGKVRIVAGLVLCLCVLCGFSLDVTATEQVTGSLQSITEDVVAYDSQDDPSSSIEIKAGEIVLVAGEDSEWMHIVYQGSDLYIKKADASAVGSLENEAAAKELEKREQKDKSWIESYLAQMKAIRSGKIWRTVIVVLIVAVIVFVVFSGIRRNASDEKIK